jgi:hypothetical protein
MNDFGGPVAVDGGCAVSLVVQFQGTAQFGNQLFSARLGPGYRDTDVALVRLTP